VADVGLVADRYPGRRGIGQACRVLDLTDAGAQTPQEAWLRVVLLEGGLPRPQTQIAICGEFGDPIAYLDWGHLPLAGDGQSRLNDYHNPQNYLLRDDES
jgi:hypothetical protein